MTLLICFLLSLPAYAQSVDLADAQRTVNISRKMIDDKRNNQSAMFMNFTQEEKEKFWPLYREYRLAIAEVDDQLLGLIEDFAVKYNSMTDEQARSGPSFGFRSPEAFTRFFRKERGTTPRAFRKARGAAGGLRRR